LDLWREQLGVGRGTLNLDYFSFYYAYAHISPYEILKLNTHNLQLKKLKPKGLHEKAKFKQLISGRADFTVRILFSAKFSTSLFLPLLLDIHFIYFIFGGIGV
jgi:hypothetical protein